MNIFVLHEDPTVAADMMCDKHVPKMIVESAQMMASGLRANGATDNHFHLFKVYTKSGTTYKGGYQHHPCTVWAGETQENWWWLAQHAMALCEQYYKRFGKTHACTEPIYNMIGMQRVIPSSNLTPFAQAMPEAYKNRNAVKAYRAYYHSKQFAKWEKGSPAPDWWQGVEVTA